MRSKKKKSKQFYEEKFNYLKSCIDKHTENVPLYNLFLDNNTFINHTDYNTNSWYNTKMYDTKNNDINKYEFIESNLVKPERILKCKKIILLPSDNQKKILLDMLEGYRIIYNYTLKFIKTRQYNNIHNRRILTEEEVWEKNEKLKYAKYIKDYKKNLSENEKIVVTIIDDIIGDIFKKDIRQYQISKLKRENNYDMILDDKKLKTYFIKDEIHRVNKKFKTPVHTLNYAVKLACTSYKSSLTNLRNGNIKNFNVRYLKSTKPSLIMDIESSAIKSKSFMTSVLGKEIKNLENINYSNNNDCKLHYNKNKDIFTLLVPEEVENNINNDNKKEYISIDLGLRTLMNCKTDNYYIKIGDNVKREIERLIKREDNYKNIKNIKNKNKVLKRIRGKIKNKIDDLHWKTINYLTINYKNIIIGKWSTKSIISCEDSNLIKMNKRIIQSLSYYKLLERLKFKSLINKSNLIIQEEWYTSKTCTLCGQIKNNLGSNTVYSCNFCNLKTDRDYNGCRNIFLSCIKSIIS